MPIKFDETKTKYSMFKDLKGGDSFMVPNAIGNVFIKTHTEYTPFRSSGSSNAFSALNGEFVYFHGCDSVFVVNAILTLEK